ncbi:MAG: hypothetical protein QOD99_1346 [Chthoniobacter sp.]|jgi:hypothetical protein|nr:hypothetical protein [Chthoniobacter sp.]
MKYFLALSCLAFATTVFGQASYSDAEASQHIGETAEVHGKVVDVHVVQGSGMVMLNFGKKFPGQTLTAVIFAGKATLFPEPEKYKGATLSVTGEIRLHKEKPEITLETADQLKVLTAASPKASPQPASSPSVSGSASASPGASVTGPDGVSRKVQPFSGNNPPGL